MNDERDARVAGAAARARAAMIAGATFDDVLRTFRTWDGLSALESMDALCQIAAMGVSCAKMFVSNSCVGRSYAQLTLADLELLSDPPGVGGIDPFTRWYRQNAIIERKPYLLYMRDTARSVGLYSSATPLEGPPTSPTIALGRSAAPFSTRDLQGARPTVSALHSGPVGNAFCTLGSLAAP